MEDLRERKDIRFQALLSLLRERGIGTCEVLDCTKRDYEKSPNPKLRFFHRYWCCIVMAESEAVEGRRRNGGNLSWESYPVTKLIEKCCKKHDRIVVLKCKFYRSGRGTRTNRVRDYTLLGTFCTNCEKLVATEAGFEILGANFTFANTIREYILLEKPLQLEEATPKKKSAKKKTKKKKAA